MEKFHMEEQSVSKDDTRGILNLRYDQRRISPSAHFRCAELKKMEMKWSGAVFKTQQRASSIHRAIKN
jgi:hypothetical protein